MALVLAGCGDAEAPAPTPTLTCSDAIQVIEAGRVALDDATSAGCVVDDDCERAFTRIDCGHLGVTTACTDAILKTHQTTWDDGIADLTTRVCRDLAEPCSATMECRRIDAVNSGAFCRDGACVGFPG